MPLVDLTSAPLPVDDENADASDVSLPIQAILAVLNGHVDTTNIEPGGLAWTVMASLVDTAQLIDGAVTNAKLDDTAGELGGAWKAWTPTWTNLTVGAGGTVDAKYMRIGKLVFYRLVFTFGTGSAMGNAIFSLPVTAVALPLYTPIGQIIILDSGTATFGGRVICPSTTTAQTYVDTASGNYTGQASMSPTVPMTWTTNDQLVISGFYEAA